MRKQGWPKKSIMTAEGEIYSLPLGTYRRKIDQMMRITVPGIWREAPMFVKDTGFLAFRRPHRLVLFPADFTHRILRHKNSGLGKREKEEIRLILISLQPISLDSRGRITIPHEFAQALKITPGDTVVVTASGGWVEIWPSASWDMSTGVKGLFNWDKSS